MRLLSFKNIRVALLLSVLAVTAMTTLHQSVYSRSWTKPLDIVIFPINADGHLATDRYIQSLRPSHFSDIDRWFEREAKRYNLTLSTPAQTRLSAEVSSHPPPFPENDNPLYVMFWGLSFRWWAWRNTPATDSTLTQIRLFVMYHEGEQNKSLKHSLGMKKGLLGLVHAYADHRQTRQNNIVIAHEMLHTVGAIDKYVSWGAPAYPMGYANPERTPLFPQRNAEIMAGRIPLSHQRSYMAESLKSVQINHYTAHEINWLD